MPRRVRTKLGSRQYQNYSAETLHLAVLAVQNKEMSSGIAAQVYNIPRRTIENKVKCLHRNSPGRQTSLSSSEEEEILEQILVCADWGMPLDALDLRLIVKNYLDSVGRQVPIFKQNLPGEDWYRSFLKRHHHRLTNRKCQNISRARASVGVDALKIFFNNLKDSLEGVPPTHILNYDETNLTDDPGSKKMLFRRGCKYPERIINSTKASISLMFAAAASGELLPPFVVYRSKQLWDTWISGGPKGTKYGNTPSGWFDALHFEKWFFQIVLPWAKNLSGTKCLIGDNLSSHVNVRVIKACKTYNIRFVFLPPSSTHLCQPLDVAVFAPCKRKWRALLTDYKMRNPKSKTLEKSSFPSLLAKFLSAFDEEGKMKSNIVSGFKKCGIVPFNPDEVYSRIPESERNDDVPGRVSDTLLNYLQASRLNHSQIPEKRRRRRIDVAPGEAVDESHLMEVAQPLPSTSGTITQHVNKRRRKYSHSSDESESAFSLHHTDTEPEQEKEQEIVASGDRNGSLKDGSEQPFNENVAQEDLQIKQLNFGAFVVVKLLGKKSVKHYLGKILKYHGEGEFDVSYLRTKDRGKSFYFPTVSDEALLNVEDIVYIIEDEYFERRGKFTFSDENVKQIFEH